MTNRYPTAPPFVRWATRTLEEAGYETWAVGGAIRNTLLGLPSGDWDLATRAPPKVVLRLFPRTVPVGVDHGTVGVLTREGVLLEVTTFRKDIETSGRHAVVEFADTLEEDLSRRDFTVNAVAWHPLREEFLDPFQGRADLERGVLRTVGRATDRFSEDYLRVLRGLRFSGRFGFRIEEETWNALCGSTGRLGILSPERVREELMKVLSEDPLPSGALELYRTSGVLDALYPELAALAGCGREAVQEDWWTHSRLLTDVLSPARPRARLTALLHGLGVPEGEGPPGADAPEVRGRDRAAALMLRLRFSNADTREVTELIHAGLEAPLGLRDPADLRRWLHRAGPDRLASAARIWIAKARLDEKRWGAEPAGLVELLRRFRRELRGSPPLRTQDLAVDGRDLIGLGLKPGPRFGEILSELMARVLEEPALNDRETLLDLIRAEKEEAEA